MKIKGEKAMNRLSLIRYTSAVALGLSTLWSAAVCAAEDAGAFDKIQQIRAGDLNIGYVDIGPRDGQPVILLTPHFLGLDLGGTRMAISFDCVSIYARQKDKVIDRWLFHGRSRFGSQVLLRRDESVRASIKAMKEIRP